MKQKKKYSQGKITETYKSCNKTYTNNVFRVVKIHYHNKQIYIHFSLLNVYNYLHTCMPALFFTYPQKKQKL